MDEKSLRLRRTYRATRQEVFEAWTSPAALKAWWGPPGYGTPTVEVDLRVGGRYRLGMRKLPDGEIFYLSGVYREVKVPEKLVYTWRWESEPQYGESVVTVEFVARGDSTEVVLSHAELPTDDARERHGKGWAGCVDRLEEYFQQRKGEKS
jgi:uncharacterized protein YndB with AHSA1/START domain